MYYSTFERSSSHAFFRIFCLVTLILTNASSFPDHGALVYKNCANQTFKPTASDDPTTHTQALASLFQELTSHSNHSKFFKHSESTADDDISGAYQCRSDITDQECQSCVRSLPDISNNLCRESVAARVQLHGCYMHYKLEGAVADSDSSGQQRLLHKTCGGVSGGGVGGGGGFEEMLRAAFGELESGVVGGNGFCKTTYELVEVMAQCEGGLGSCECGECVSSAVEIAEEECGGSVSGEIYLAECFLSFAYHPDEPHQDERRERNNGSDGRTVAIVVGGAAALCFGFIFVLFLKSWGKKDDE